MAATAAIAFAKPAFDVGFATNDLDGFRALWEGRLGLAYDHLAKLGGGFHQHRWRQGDSILKVNHTRTPLAAAPVGGYRALLLAGDEDADLQTPDGTPIVVRRVPGADLTLRAVTADTDAFARFYGERLGLKPDGPHAFRLGESRIVAAEGPAPARAGWRERGLRYMTVQIFDCDGLTAALERQGVEVGMAPRTIGQVRYSFVRDPDGNWIELSERASLTGKPVREG
ncbi:MAG: VOC family protein [Alphaproteobacteria bacterium]|nr:VOC family protein [Alphaproteobacteria bacterium]MCB9928411.1 VOC family protein [Alphaproteobacteria bacterium]